MKNRKDCDSEELQSFFDAAAIMHPAAEQVRTAGSLAPDKTGFRP